MLLTSLTNHASGLPVAFLAMDIPTISIGAAAGLLVGGALVWIIKSYTQNIRKATLEAELTGMKNAARAEAQKIHAEGEAHARGRALLMTTHRERAELYKEQFASKKVIVTIGPA